MRYRHARMQKMRCLTSLISLIFTIYTLPRLAFIFRRLRLLPKECRQCFILVSSHLLKPLPLSLQNALHLKLCLLSAFIWWCWYLIRQSHTATASSPRRIIGFCLSHNDAQPRRRGAYRLCRIPSRGRAANDAAFTLTPLAWWWCWFLYARVFIILHAFIAALPLFSSFQGLVTSTRQHYARSCSLRYQPFHDWYRVTIGELRICAGSLSFLILVCHQAFRPVKFQPWAANVSPCRDDGYYRCLLAMIRAVEGHLFAPGLIFLREGLILRWWYW